MPLFFVIGPEQTTYDMRKLFPLILLTGILPAILPAQQYADCIKAKEICKKQTLNIDKAYGEGADRQEANYTACFMNGENFGQAEENSTWIRFDIKEGGTLAFTITPHNAEDDIDFVVYRLPGGDCYRKQIVRCMAAGDTRAAVRTSPCMGKTGLKSGEKDTSEDAGCGDADDNTWLAPLNVRAGETYAILVSNVSTAGPGFSISFSGTCKLPCEEEKTIAQAPPAKPPVTKPKDPVDIAPRKKPTELQPLPTVLPYQIGGREVNVNKSITVSKRKIKLRIWDSQVEDGDIISIFLDDKKVISNLYLRIKPQEYEIEFPTGTVHYLTLYAEDFGKAEPNTAKVLIIDGDNQQEVDLVAGRSSQESIRIITPN